MNHLKIWCTLVILILTIPHKGKGAICTAVSNGAWNTASNWSCGFVPTCGDLIIIPSGITVTITTQQSYYPGCTTAMTLSIYGTLKFVTGNKLELPCNSQLYIHAGASIQPGGGGGNSNLISICDNTVWNAGSGTLTGPSCLPPSLPGCSTTLPIELLNFKAVQNNGFIELSWTTATEKNSDYFNIERSGDAINFTTLAKIKSIAENGTSLKPIDYLLSDFSPLPNTGYYRLKHFDFNRSFTYSQIISISYLKAENIKFIIFPNPNDGEFTVDISGVENNHEVHLTLTDQAGKLIKKSSFFIQDAQNTQFKIVPETKLQSGVYLCTLTIEGVNHVIKVIIS